mmetsp:Transcript_12669/g.36689  ORF Transcript_12669/g.36689 Transcript_12669/m.36689 type:complete len:263 (+) Transcript_12669:778-1566(+)
MRRRLIWMLSAPNVSEFFLRSSDMLNLPRWPAWASSASHESSSKNEDGLYFFTTTGCPTAPEDRDAFSLSLSKARFADVKSKSRDTSSTDPGPPRRRRFTSEAPIPGMGRGPPPVPGAACRWWFGCPAWRGCGAGRACARAIVGGPLLQAGVLDLGGWLLGAGGCCCCCCCWARGGCCCCCCRWRRWAGACCAGGGRGAEAPTAPTVLGTGGGGGGVGATAAGTELFLGTPVAPWTGAGVAPAGSWCTCRSRISMPRNLTNS